MKAISNERLLERIKDIRSTMGSNINKTFGVRLNIYVDPLTIKRYYNMTRIWHCRNTKDTLIKGGPYPEPDLTIRMVNNNTIKGRKNNIQGLTTDYIMVD